MKISDKTAMMIVRELKYIIKHDITFMDTNSHIIASTDETRIGDYHAATHRMLEEQLEKLIVYDDNEYEGTRKGLNTVIEINDAVVAVLGVTGDWREVESYVRILKKMTEILLLDEIYNDRKRKLQETRNRFVYEWVLGHTNWVENSFYGQGLNIGIDITLPRRVVVVSCMQQSDAGNQQIFEDRWEHILPIVKDYFKNNKELIWLTNGYRLIILIPQKNNKIIKSSLIELQKLVFHAGDIKLSFGVDSVPTFSEDTREGYRRADKALLSCRYTVSNGITFYDDINIEIFMGEIRQETKREYVGKIFSSCSKKEIDYWCHVLSALYQNNGSISKTSEQLFLHKNTLQYQLKKLRRISGYDPRALGETSVLYLAMIMWRNIWDT